MDLVLATGGADIDIEGLRVTEEDMEFHVDSLPGQPGTEEGSVLLGAISRCSTCTASRKKPSPKKLVEEEEPQGEERRFEGTFERRGLRRWDVFWNSSFAELRGRVLTVYDVDSFESERTLLVHVVLSADFEVARMSETEWQLRSSQGGRARTSDLHFQWRVPDASLADQWVKNLEEACLPEKVAAQEDPAAKEPAAEGGDQIIDSVILQSMLSPALLGFAVFDASAMKVVVNLWGQLADIVNGAVITPDTPAQKEAKETLEHAARPFQVARRQFEACFLGEADVELKAFVEACEGFSGVLALMGSWTVPLAREGYKNCDMISSRIDKKLPAVSLRAMLEEEASQGIHRPGGMIADPSLAVGALWAYRGMSLWAEMCRRCAVPTSWPGGPPAPPANLLKRSFDHAYDVAIKPYHGMLLQSGVAMATNFLPPWEDVSSKFGPAAAEVREDIARWLSVMDALLPRLDALIQEFDFNDTRRTF